MELRTAGEQLVRHPLMAERIGGVPHYLAGQHHAGVERVVHEGEDLGIAGTVDYVDQSGHAVLAVCEYEDGEWVPRMVARCGHSHGSFEAWSPAEERRFKLSEKMIDVLNKAKEEAGL